MENLQCDAKKTQIIVQNFGEDEKFIVWFTGLTCDIGGLEKEIVDSESECLFDKGCGEYLFDCFYYDGQYDEMYRCECPPYWELIEKDFKAF